MSGDIEKLKQAIRRMAQRATHTARLPAGDWTAAQLVEQGRYYGMHARVVEDQVQFAHRFGRIYKLWKSSSGWCYRAEVDPYGGIDDQKKAEAANQSLFSEDADTNPAPASVWWKGVKTLPGRFVAFDLETTPVVEGEFPEIVLASASDEQGHAYLLEKHQICDWWLRQMAEHPHQIICNWFLSGFDLPTMIYRIPGFRERVFPEIERRVWQGLVLDTMLMVQLRDIALYGGLLRHGEVGSWQQGWGAAVYGLGPQAKRFLGVDLPKTEQLLFWPYVGRAREVQENMASYALADGLACACIMQAIYDDAEVWAVAEQARQEMDRLNGVRLDWRDGRYVDPLVKACNLKFGWQTHTIQFLSTLSLAYTSITGVAINVEHAFGVIEELEDELNWLRAKLAGRPGRSIYQLHSNGQREELVWAPETVTFERVRQHLAAVLDDEDMKLEEGAVDVFQIRKPSSEMISPLFGTAMSGVYDFVSPKGVRKKAIAQYVSDHLKQLKKRVAKGQRLNEKELEEIGLQGDEWLIKFGVDSVDDMPDPVLSLYFRITERQKRLATIKTYLPGVASHDHRTKLTGMPATKLRSWVRTLIKRRGLKGLYVFPRFKALGPASGRSSASDPNTQQPERNDRIRNIFAAIDWAYEDWGPPIEFWLVVCDFGAAEMVTQADIYAHRYPDVPHEMKLSTVLNEGFDDHIRTALMACHGSQRELWWPILSDERLRNLKRAISAEDKRRAIEVLRQDPHPLCAKLDPVSNKTGEDLAKDLWIDLLAEAFCRAEVPSCAPPTDVAWWAATWKAVKSKDLKDEALTPEQRALRGWTKDIKRKRQGSKPPNFGIPGGMKPPRIVTSAKIEYQVVKTLAEAERDYQSWMEAHPEGERWLADGTDDIYRVDDPPFPYVPYYDRCFTLTGRLRGKLAQPDLDLEPHEDRGEALKRVAYDPGLNEWHNTQFQGEAADGAKLADYFAWREGIERWNFVHDEEGSWVTAQAATETQQLLVGCMIKGMSMVVTKVGVTVGGNRMRAWEK